MLSFPPSQRSALFLSCFYFPFILFHCPSWILTYSCIISMFTVTLHFIREDIEALKWPRIYCKSSTNWQRKTLHLFRFPRLKAKWQKTFSISHLWQTLGSVLGCRLRIKLPHIESYKSPVERIFFLWCNLSYPIFLVFTVYIFVNLAEEHIARVGAACHWCRHATVVLVLAGLRGQCVGRDGGSAGLCGGSWPVPLGSGRPTSIPLIHEGVNTRVKTHSLTRCNTLLHVGVDETRYFVGLW